MLVLTRKANQSIMIGDGMEISVLAIMGEKVRIGIQAPREVPVYRKEVYLEIQKEQDGGAADERDDAANGQDEAVKDARDQVDAALRGLGNPE